MDFSLRDMNVGRYLGHHVKQRADLDSTLGLSEESPLEQTQAEVNRRGVESIEPSMQLKLPVESLALSESNHMIGKLLKDPVIPVGVGICDVTQLDIAAPKTEMVALILHGVNDVDDFPKAVAAGKLSKHHHQKLVPAREGLHVLVALVLLYDSIKDSLGQKLNELTVDVFSAIHAFQAWLPAAKFGNHFKSIRGVIAYN